MATLKEFFSEEVASIILGWKSEVFGESPSPDTEVILVSSDSIVIDGFSIKLRQYVFGNNRFDFNIMMAFYQHGDKSVIYAREEMYYEYHDDNGG